jgi:hypothetical protein
MPQPTATRRLVKSPPELWAELGSEDSLGRHLAEFGEIRITRVEPETTVAWEGDRASGTVRLSPTGWGTKVVLTATPAQPSPDAPPAMADVRTPATRAGTPPAPPVAEAAAPATRAGALSAPPVAEAGAPATRADALSAPPVAEAAAPATRAGELWAPAAKRGFFARLFRKRRAASPPAPASSIPAPPAPTPDPVPPTPAPGPGPIPPPAPDPVPPAPAPEPPAPPQIEVLDADRTVAILTEVLDDLGAAHHRPFSRD